MFFIKIIDYVKVLIDNQVVSKYYKELIMERVALPVHAHLTVVWVVTLCI